MVMKRFEVREESMLPTLAPGEEFVATDSHPATPGDVVVFPHPRREDFWLVKRLGRLDADGTAWVESDNAEVSATDSRAFGAVPVAGLMPKVERLDETTFHEAVALLAAEDEDFARTVASHGIPPFWHREPGFPALVLLILEQQVSLESGAAMYRRLIELLGDVTAARVVSAGESSLQEIGVTRQKATYLVGLADLVDSGELDLDGLASFDRDEARTLLIGIKGIGPWTADAYLLSALRFPDEFPVGDRALQVGTQEVLGLETDPSEAELETLSEPWRPVRAAAARLIWHAYLEKRGRREPEEVL
jgi:DNA-3-methyladenine glycosylase II